MRHGARINNNKYLKNRFLKCEKCVVCEKALRKENKCGLCTIHYCVEYYKNICAQGIYKERYLK